MKTIDKVDNKILDILQKNSRLSYRKVSRLAGVSVATAINRVRLLENEGVIKKHTIQIDHDKIGYDLEVVIFIRVSKGKLFDVEKRISLYKNVYAVYDITGSFDALVIARFKNRRELDNFIKKVQEIEYVERTETNLILNKIKEENV
jgi:DNA-binding Lrp family transcriptional regulator